MEHAHDHARLESRRALGIALGLTAAYTVVEVVGGLLTGSLALLADAVHMLSDNVALALALVALWLASRPSTPERTYGYKRAEVLAALANGVLLVALAIWIFVEAVMRLHDPGDVLGGWMLAIAIVGIAVNLGAGIALARPRHDSINVEAAFLCGLALGAWRLGPWLHGRGGSRGRDPRDRLGAGGRARQHPHRRPRARERVGDRA